jgi:hypothetical protein
MLRCNGFVDVNRRQSAAKPHPRKADDRTQGSEGSPPIPVFCIRSSGYALARAGKNFGIRNSPAEISATITPTGKISENVIAIR